MALCGALISPMLAVALLAQGILGMTLTAGDVSFAYGKETSCQIGNDCAGGFCMSFVNAYGQSTTACMCIRRRITCTYDYECCSRRCDVGDDGGKTCNDTEAAFLNVHLNFEVDNSIDEASGEVFVIERGII